MRTTPDIVATRKAIIATETARMLIEAKAILFTDGEPFTFTSGMKSPVYTDMRKIIAYPRIRSWLIYFAVETIETEIGYVTIAGCPAGCTGA